MKAKCINRNGCTMVTEGEIYEVTNLSNRYITIIADDGNKHKFFPRNFEIFEEDEMMETSHDLLAVKQNHHQSMSHL